MGGIWDNEDPDKEDRLKSSMSVRKRKAESKLMLQKIAVMGDCHASAEDFHCFRPVYSFRRQRYSF